MRFASVILMFILQTGLAIAAQDILIKNDSSIKSDVSLNSDLTKLDLARFDSKWWTEIENASSEQKPIVLLSYQKAFQRSVKSYQIDLTLENIGLVNQLFRSLAEQYEKKELATLAFSADQSYTIKNWMNLISKNRSVEREIALASAELSQLTLMDKDHSATISKKLVSYRKLANASMSRKLLAVEVMRYQLEKLLLVEQHHRMTLRIKNLEVLFKAQQQQIKLVIEKLQPDPVQQEQRITQMQALTQSIEQIEKSLYRLELNRLSYSNENIQMKIRVEELELSTQHLEKSIELIALELETQIEKIIANELDDSSSVSLSHWNDLQAQKTKLNQDYDYVFERINLQRVAENSEEQNDNWLRLQKTRALIQMVDNRVREVNHLFTAITLLQNQRVSWSQRTLDTVYGLFNNGGASLRSMIDFQLFEINDTPVTLLDVFWAVSVIFIAIFVSSRIRKVFTQFAKTKTNVSEAAVFTIGRIIHYVIIIAAVIIGFSTLGIDFSKLALVAGALSVGIGFGLQSIFNNFISGLILLFERPFKIGDLIELESGLRGRIKSINVRSTQITTWDNIDILVPNSEFISGRVTNYTFNDDLRRLHVPFGVAYGADKDLVYKAVVEAANRVPFTLLSDDHAPDVWLVGYGDNSLNFELIVWIETNKLPRRGNPKAAYLWEIETSLAQYKIEIPFPQRDLHLRSIDEKLLNKMSLGGAQTNDNSI